MNSTVLQQIKLLSPSERLQLVQDIWDDLAAEGDALTLIEAQRAELDRRLALHGSRQAPATSLDEIAKELGVKL